MNDLGKVPSDQVFHRFLRLLRHLRRYRHQMKHRGIRLHDYSALRFLLESGPSTVGQMRAYLHKSPGTTSTLIAQLEKAGHVTRTRSKKDNRVVIVELTSAGQEFAERTPLGGLPLLRRRLQTLSEERLALIDGALTEIMQLMEVPDNK